MIGKDYSPTMLILFFFTLLAGVATIVAPCIWPLLPIILSATITGGKRKPLGIVTGISVAFLFATLALSYLIRIIPFDPETLRLVGVGVIGFFGMTLIVPSLGRWLEARVSRLMNFGGRTLHLQGDGFWSGLLVGMALGLVWSPCAGPILATVATLAATQALDWTVVLLALTFVVGVAIPLYFLALLGQRLLAGTRRLSPYTGMIQRVFGVIMLAAAIIIYTGYDKTLQTKLIETYPVCGVVLNSFETNPWVLEELKKLRFRQVDEASDPVKSVNHVPQPQAKTLPNLGPAPAFSELGPWINTAPLSLEGLRGQVVLIHFWTFGCINCIRTLPAVTKWYEQYREQGLVVVGIHTPEFAYERELKSVERAVKERGITYPVALDNQYATWNAYENQYWPAFYLIDATGKLRYTHFGEGRYETTEKAIENLIQEAQALPESQ